MGELEKLYKLLEREGYYTKSYEEFEQRYNNDDSYREKVFGVVSRDGFYTKSKDNFFQKYQFNQPEVKKKEYPSSVTSPMEPMDSTLPQEDISGLSESEELLGETESKPKDPVELIIDGFSVDTDLLTNEELAPYKVDDDLRERSAILGSESVFFNKASKEVAKSRYIQDQLKQKAETIDGYYRDKIKSDLSKDLEFRKINTEIESKYGNLINSKRNELRRKVFNGEISRGESKDVLLKLINDAEVRIAKEKSENDYLNQKYMEAINQYKDEWQGSRDRLSDKAEEIVNDIDANSFFKPLRNAVLQVYKTSMATVGSGVDVVSDVYNNFNPKYKELEYQTTLELSELAGVDVPEGLKGKKREDLTLTEVKDLINLKAEVKEVLGKSTYNNLIKDKEREFFRKNPGERSAIQNLAADFMDSAQAFEEMSDSIGLVTKLSDINSVGDFGDWAWNTVSQLGSQVAMSGLTGGGYLYAQGIADTYYDSLMELAKEHKEKTGEDLTMQEILDLSDSRMVASSMAGGITIGVLEKYGLDKLLKGNGIGLKAIVESGTEGLQEIVQAVATDVGTDKKFKDVADRFKSSEFWGQVGESSAAGAFGGGFVGGLGKLRKSRGDEELKLSTITANEDLKNKVMKSEVASGKYKLGDAFVTRTDINDAIENAKTPEDLNNIEVTDDKGIQDKLESKLNQLQDAVQEQETREVPDAKPAEGVQEVETEVRESDIQEKRKEIELRRQEELDPVRTALARAEQTGEVPTVDGELVNKKTLDEINTKYDTELDGLQETRPKEESFKVSEALGSTVFIDNKKGTLKIDDTEGAGKKVIFESEDGTQIRDIGDIDVIGNRPIGEFNLKQEVGTTQEQIPTRAEGETVINTEGDVVTSPEGVQEGPQRSATFLRERKDGSIVVKDERGLQRAIKGDQARQFKMRFPNVKKGDGVRFQLSDTFIEDGNSIDQKTTSEVSISDTKRTSELKERQSDENKKDVINYAEKAINTLKSVLPNFEIYIHDSVDSYNSFVDSIGAPRASRGNFAYRTNENGNIEGRIDINLSTADKVTVAHEVTHGILLKTLDGSPQLYENFRRKISSVLSDSTNKKLNDFANQYIDNDGNLLDVTHEEYLAELTALLSQQGKSLPISTLEKIAKIINQIVSKATKGKLKPFQSTANKNDVLEYFNSISRSLSEGTSLDGVTEKINTEAPSTGKNVDVKSLESKSSLIEDLGLTRFPDMKKRIKTGVTLNDLGPVISHLTFSDRLVTGKVGDKDYLGGILFASATNRVWAAFSKGRVSQIINGMPLNEDGYRYLMPAILTEEAHMSNKDMTNTSIRLVEEAVASNTIVAEDANKRISRSLNRKGLEKSKDIYSEYIETNGVSSKSVSDGIKKSLSETTFEQRKIFLESLLGKADIDKSKRFGGLPSFSGLANGLAEPITSGHNYGDILLTIRTKGDLVAVQPKETDPDYHPSYPWVIRALNKDGSIANVETLIFNESYSAIDVFPKVTNKKGKILTYNQYVEKYGDKAKSFYLGYMGGRSTMSTSVTEQVDLGADSKKEISLESKSQINDALSKASGTTQVPTTTGSYVKAANKLKDNLVKGDVLDYGAGLGLGTDAMSSVLEGNVDSLEVNPERWKGKTPVTYTDAKQIQKKYDGVVSLNVVNVVPKKVRDFIVQDIFNKLSPGGVAVISSRGFKGDIANSKNFELGPEPKSYIIKRKKAGETIDVFQKGYDGNELVDYARDILGDDAEVIKDNTFGKSGILIKKKLSTKQQLPNQQKDNVSKDFQVFTTKNNISLSRGFKGVARNIGSLRSLRLKDAKIPFKKDPVNLVIGNPDVGISIGELMTYYKRSLFSAKRFFSKDLFKGKELKEAKIAKNLNIVEQNVAKLNRAIRKNKLDSEEQIQQLDLFLRRLPNTLNEKIIPIATEMRQHVDSLSQILIDNGWVADTKQYVVEKVSKDKGEYFVIDTGTGSRIKLSPAKVKQIEVDGKAPAEGETVTISSAVNNNLGEYLTRSYKIFDDANWKDKVEDVIVQRAKNLYRQQLRSVAERLQLKNAKEQIRERLLPQYTNDDGTVNELELNQQVENEYSDMDGQQIGNEIESILEQMVDNKIDEVLKSDDVKGFLKKGKLGSKDLSILKERKDIPLEIRMLMGEYTDPIQNYARTILKQSSLVANQRFLESSKEMGMGNFFFEADQPRPRGFDFQIAAEGSETMAPLNGLYTTKEIYEQFQDASESLPVYFEIYMKAISSVKWAKTIGSVTTHLKNFFGNLAFMAANGHWRVGEMNKAFAIIKNDISSKSNEELNEMMNEYIDLTIVKQSAGLNEIRDMFKDANFDEAMYQRLSKKPTNIGKAKRLGLKSKKFLEDVYGGTDDLFKIVAYENEMSRYSQALYGKDKSSLTEAERGELSSYVAEIVKNTYPTYSRVPEAIQLIRRFPLLGNFVSFQAESWRTAYNTLNIAKNEMKSDNPKVRKIGRERMIGITSYLAIKDTLISYFSVQAGMGLSGIIGSLIDDDEEKEKQNALKKYVAPWNKNSEKIMLEAKEGELRYIDLSSSDPYGGIAKVFNALASGDDLEEKTVEGFLAAIEPFIGVDITTNTLSQVIYNDNGYGGRIYNPENPDRINKMLTHVIKKLEPGTISSIRRLGKTENLTQEVAAQLLGLRTYDSNLSDSFGFKFIGKDGYRERLKDAKSLFTQKYDKDATLKDIVEGKKVSDNALQDVYIDIYDDLSAAIRLGAPVPELIKKMKSLGLSSKDIKIVLLAGSMKDND